MSKKKERIEPMAGAYRLEDHVSGASKSQDFSARARVAKTSKQSDSDKAVREAVEEITKIAIDLNRDALKELEKH